MHRPKAPDQTSTRAAHPEVEGGPIGRGVRVWLSFSFPFTNGDVALLFLVSVNFPRQLLLNSRA